MTFNLAANEEPTPVIRLRTDLDELEPNLDDWTIVPGSEPLMQHRPSRSIFQIGDDTEVMAKAGHVTVFMLHAFLIHQCGQSPVPRGERLEKLGREAILAFWMILIGEDDRGMDLSGDVVFSETEAGVTGRWGIDAVELPAEMKELGQIRLDSSLIKQAPDLKEWKFAVAREALMLHRPSQCIFKVDYDETMIREGEDLTLSALYAELIDQSGPLPSIRDICRIAREAILALWVMFNGYDEFVKKEASDALQPRCRRRPSVAAERRVRLRSDRRRGEG